MSQPEKIRTGLENGSMSYFLKIKEHETKIVGLVLFLISLGAFLYYYQNGLGLAYSDSQSHLNIARRIIDNLTPGFAQIGSIWLPVDLNTVFLWTIFLLWWAFRLDVRSVRGMAITCKYDRFCVEWYCK